MIDPATGWFEIVEIPNRRADYVANYLEFAWLTRYPWPTEIILDRGKEFLAEVQAMLWNEYGIARKLITTRHPQANAIVEHVHQVIGNMIRSAPVKDKRDLDDAFNWDGILAATRRAVNSTVHTTMRASPTQLVFGRDALLNIGFAADWNYIKSRKQKVIQQNNKRENATRVAHTYHVHDKVMVRQDPNRKFQDRFRGPYTVTHVYENGTVQLRRDADNRPGGAVFQTWNIRNLNPCMA